MLETLVPSPTPSPTSKQIHLPNEVLASIFRCLADDRRTLCKCLLVNRQWCMNAVPILWRSTFHYFSERRINAPIRRPLRLALIKLVAVYIHHLSSGSKQRLHKIGIPGLKPGMVLNSIFDYPSYLRKLDTKRIYEAVYEWFFAVSGNTKFDLISVKNATPISPSVLPARIAEDRIRAIVKELGKLFMQRCQTLETLDIHYELFLTEYYGPSEFSHTDPNLSFLLNDNKHTSLPLFSGADICLRHLKEFECGRGRKAGLLFSLTSIAHNLEKLNVAMFYDTEFPCDREAESVALVSLITAQKKLAHFLLGGANYALPNLDTALLTQQDSLTCLDFCDVDMRDVKLDAIAGLINLEKIKFRYCYGFTEVNMWELSKARFPRLKKLRFFRSYPPFVCVLAMVKNASATLKTLCLGSEASNKDTILTYPPLLPFCKNIKKLELSGEFTPASLEYFLQNCKAQIESLHMGRCWELTDDHVQVVISYAREHKEFRRLNTLYVTKLSRWVLVEAKKWIREVVAHSEYRLDSVALGNEKESEVIVID